MINIVIIKIEKDFQTGERCGAGGTFQLTNVYGCDDNGNTYDLSKNFDVGTHRFSNADIIDEIERMDFGNFDLSGITVNDIDEI